MTWMITFCRFSTRLETLMGYQALDKLSHLTRDSQVLLVEMKVNFSNLPRFLINTEKIRLDQWIWVRRLKIKHSAQVNKKRRINLYQTKEKFEDLQWATYWRK